MKRRRRQAVLYISGFLVVLLSYTFIYMALMSAVENEPRTFTQALLVVVETFTLTGYGEDATAWSTPQLRLYVILMNATGVFFILLALPLFGAPYIEERLSASVPTTAEMDDHVVICGYTSRTEMLIDELRVFDVPYVLVEPDRETATELYERTLTTVRGDPESTETLSDVDVSDARALVTDVGDERNASVALTARQASTNQELQVISFAEDPEVVEYHEYAGADRSLLPRHLIGESLANKVTAAMSADIGDAVEIDEDFELVELPVQTGSELDGVQITESNIRERTGANIIGAWFRGQFVSPPSPDAYIDSQTVLLVAGRDEQLQQLKKLTLSETRRRRFGDVVVLGHGEVGSTVKQHVTTAGLPCTTVDNVDRSGVDVVGDATDAETLREAGVPEASTVIVALPGDTHSVFATLVTRRLTDDAEIIARANETANTEKLYRAGADYALALSTVSGRMLASTILEERVISFDQSIEIVRMDLSALAGQRLDEADIRARTGCTVLAIERGDETLTDLGPAFRFRDGDQATVVGPDQGVLELSSMMD